MNNVTFQENEIFLIKIYLIQIRSIPLIKAMISYIEMSTKIDILNGYITDIASAYEHIL